MKTKRPKHKKWIKLVEKFNSISYSNSEDVRYKAMFYGAALGILRVLDVYEDYFLMGQDKVIEILSDTNTPLYPLNVLYKDISDYTQCVKEFSLPVKITPKRIVWIEAAKALIERYKKPEVDPLERLVIHGAVYGILSPIRTLDEGGKEFLNIFIDSATEGENFFDSDGFSGAYDLEALLKDVESSC